MNMDNTQKQKNKQKTKAREELRTVPQLCTLEMRK
jgi:hypothetical protein